MRKQKSFKKWYAGISKTSCQRIINTEPQGMSYAEKDAFRMKTYPHLDRWDVEGHKARSEKRNAKRATKVDVPVS